MRLRCAYCDTLEPVPAVRSSHTQLAPHITAVNQCQPAATPVSVTPGAVMARATLEPTPLMLANEAHLVPNRNHEQNRSHLNRINELRQKAIEATETSSSTETEPRSSTITSPTPHVAGFFMTFFVFGQVMSNWALYADHYSAWICGLVFSVVGITIAVGSLLSGMKTRNRMILRLQSVRRDGPHQPAIPQASIGLVDASPQKASA